VDYSTIWLLALATAGPVAGIVGFAIQLRQVKKLRLENEKLQLEIQALRARARRDDQRIVEASDEQVLRIARPKDLPMFSRARSPDDVRAPSDEGAIGPRASLLARVRDLLIVVGIATVVILVLAYLLYDLYRIGAWLLRLTD
jgi:hypothetical protein